MWYLGRINAVESTSEPLVQYRRRFYHDGVAVFNLGNDAFEGKGNGRPYNKKKCEECKPELTRKPLLFSEQRLPQESGKSNGEFSQIRLLFKLRRRTDAV